MSVDSDYLIHLISNSIFPFSFVSEDNFESIWGKEMDLTLAVGLGGHCVKVKLKVGLCFYVMHVVGCEQ